jgi:hypothetical protein
MLRARPFLRLRPKLGGSGVRGFRGQGFVDKGFVDKGFVDRRDAHFVGEDER